MPPLPRRLLFTSIATLSTIFILFHRFHAPPPLPVAYSPPPFPWHSHAPSLHYAALRLQLPRLPNPAAPRSPDLPLTLDPAQELAAISSFLAALPQNAIPAFVDPAQPIDPQLVLDFDTHAGPRAHQELATIVDEVWQGNPVILFGRLHSQLSKELKKILMEMYLSPPPLVFDVDQRSDAHVLTVILKRLTGTLSLPILLIGGQPVSVSTLRDIQTLRDSGELKALILRAGSVVGDAKKKRGRN